MIRRKRAVYSAANAGLIGFRNRTGEGHLEFVSFCTRDTMYHVGLRHSPFPNDDRCVLAAEAIGSANRIYNGAEGGVANVGRSSPAAAHVVSVWYPGNIDLEDMVAIVESIPEFDARWLRPEFEKLKIRAGLDKNDLPYLDRDLNAEAGNWRNGKFIRKAFYDGGWMSGKGGTLDFAKETPEPTLLSAGCALEAKAKVDLLADDGGCPSLRFIWSGVCKTPAQTKEKIRDILSEIPGAMKPAGFRP